MGFWRCSSERRRELSLVRPIAGFATGALDLQRRAVISVDAMQGDSGVEVDDRAKLLITEIVIRKDMERLRHGADHQLVVEPAGGMIGAKGARHRGPPLSIIIFWRVLTAP